MMDYDGSGGVWLGSVLEALNIMVIAQLVQLEHFL
jgi:hypothetical protein